MEMGPSDLHPAVFSALAVLLLLPLLLLTSFLTFGRRRRRHSLISLGVARRPAHELVAFADVQSRNETFGAYLARSYSELHRWQNYALPALVFLLPYAVGLYWSAVVATHLADPKAPAFAGDAAFLDAAALPAVGFLGGALAALFHLGSRIIRNDVSPRMLHHMALRLVIAPVLALVIASTVDGLWNDRAGLIAALMSGFVPVEALRFASDWIAELISRKPVEGGELPLAAIQGIEREDELRLWEEGITNAEKLAVESTVSLLVYTNFSLETLTDWKDQAFLYCYAPTGLAKLRAMHVRGAMDVLGLDTSYYDEARSGEMRDALARDLGQPRAVIDRFVDTVFNDPRVHQIWEYLKHSYPTEVAKPIIERLEHRREQVAAGGRRARAPEAATTGADGQDGG